MASPHVASMAFFAEKPAKKLDKSSLVEPVVTGTNIKQVGTHFLSRWSSDGGLISRAFVPHPAGGMMAARWSSVLRMMAARWSSVLRMMAARWSSVLRMMAARWSSVLRILSSPLLSSPLLSLAGIRNRLGVRLLLFLP